MKSSWWIFLVSVLFLVAAAYLFSKSNKEGNKQQPIMYACFVLGLLSMIAFIAFYISQSKSALKVVGLSSYTYYPTNLVYGSGKVVAFSPDNVTRYSSNNGSSWTVGSTLPIPSQIVASAYDGDDYWAVGNGTVTVTSGTETNTSILASIFSSTDGINWTTAITATGVTGNCVCTFNSGKSVVVGGASGTGSYLWSINHSVTSPTWASVAPAVTEFSSPIVAVTSGYLGNTSVVMIASSAGSFMYSSDLSTWTALPSLSATVNSLVYSNQRWVIGTNSAYYYVSKNPVNGWVQYTHGAPELYGLEAVTIFGTPKVFGYYNNTVYFTDGDYSSGFTQLGQVSGGITSFTSTSSAVIIGIGKDGTSNTGSIAVVRN